MNIFFDLDGTLLDISRKYYLAHTLAANKFNIKCLSFKEYWLLKRKKTTEDIIIKIDAKSQSYKLYEKERRKLLEDENILDKDALFPGVFQILRTLQKNNKLFLITLRNNKKALRNQLIKLNIKSFFNQVLSNYSAKNPTKTKVAMIRKIGFQVGDIIVGDTEADISAGRELGIKSIAVASGIRTRYFLRHCKPDLVIKDISQLTVC